MPTIMISVTHIRVPTYETLLVAGHSSQNGGDTFLLEPAHDAPIERVSSISTFSGSGWPVKVACMRAPLEPGWLQKAIWVLVVPNA